MDLKNEYKKRTGKDAETHNTALMTCHTESYINWLEHNVIKLFAIPFVSKRYKFTFKEMNTDELVVVYEDTERKAFLAASRIFEKPKDREWHLVSKEQNVC